MVGDNWMSVVVIIRDVWISHDELRFIMLMIAEVIMMRLTQYFSNRISLFTKYHCTPLFIEVVLILSILIQIWMIFQRYIGELDEINPTEDYIYIWCQALIQGKYLRKAFHTCLYNRLHDKISNRFTYDICICHNFGYCIFPSIKFPPNKVFIKYSYKIISNNWKINRHYQANCESGVADVFHLLKSPISSSFTK